jgi:hypothetical protein
MILRRLPLRASVPGACQQLGEAGQPICILQLRVRLGALLDPTKCVSAGLQAPAADENARRVPTSVPTQTDGLFTRSWPPRATYARARSTITRGDLWGLQPTDLMRRHPSCSNRVGARIKSGHERMGKVNYLSKLETNSRSAIAVFRLAWVATVSANRRLAVAVGAGRVVLRRSARPSARGSPLHSRRSIG